MDIDPTTAADLEMFDSVDNSGSILDLIDTTVTLRGRTALRRRFRNPSSDVAEIQRVQEALQFLQVNADLIRLSDTSVAAVDRYLASNIQVSSSGTILVRVEHS